MAAIFTQKSLAETLAALKLLECILLQMASKIFEVSVLVLDMSANICMRTDLE